MLGQQAMLAAIADWAMMNIGWLVAALIVVAGLVVYGGGDLFRLSIGRIRAIASVCFRESIRRRVLWLVPLAILGVVLVAQFQAPLDEQDAIRQATKFCIFTAGLLVTMASVILGCTTLPHEIDNRVIYTIVTKPTSRLEILLGKIAGFAGISASILLIMGVFTWGYVHVQEWGVQRTIDERLQAGGLEPATEQILKYHQKHGVLDARRFLAAADIQVYGRYPTGDEKSQWIATGENEAYIPFDVRSELKPGRTITGLALALRLPWERRTLNKDELTQTASMAEAAGIKSQLPDIPAGPGEATKVEVDFPAFAFISIAGGDLNTVIDSSAIHGQSPFPIRDVKAGPIVVPLSADIANRILMSGRFYVRVQPSSPGTRFQVNADSVAMLLQIQESQQPVLIRSKRIDSAFHTDYLVVGRVNQNGQQLASAGDKPGPIAVIAFRSSDVPQFASGQLGFELRSTLERAGDEADEQSPTYVEVQIVDQKTGQKSEPVKVAIESRRTAHFTVPSSVITAGDFDVTIRLLTTHHWVSLKPGTLRLAGENQGFGLNLSKSLLILWMFSILVITIAIFCSTFVSWPIALVLTLVILLGHWGVQQLGDFTAPGVGRQIVGDLFAGTAPAAAETLNRTVEGLSSLTRMVAVVLPDISRFAAMSDIEQGVAISPQRIIEALVVLLVFGLPILSLSYVFFRNKEVAP